MLVTKMSENSLALSESGVKGHSLFSMTNAKLPVPPWIIIGKSAFKQFKEYSEIEHIIDQALSSIALCHVTLENLISVSNTIRNVILSAPIPDDLEHEICSAYKLIDSKYIAVRSSVVDKDSPKYSFAGQYSNFLFITTFEDAIRSLKECWVSAFSPRALAYRTMHKLPLSSSSIDMAVIFQKMVSSEKSGVLITANPINGDSESISINALFGVGEGFSNGMLDVDTYKFSKSQNRITLLSIVNKQFEFKLKSPDGGLAQLPLPNHLQNISCLSNQEIIELVNIGKKIEQHYNAPQEIEWAWTENEGFSVLQSRSVNLTLPIEKIQNQRSASANDFSTSLTYPLTFGFMQHLYHHAFLQLCKSMSMSKKEIKAIDPYLEHMLGSIFGRTYFNILNIYRLTSLILPSIKNRHAYLDFSTGYQGLNSDSLSKHEDTLPKKNHFRSAFRKVISLVKCLWYHCRMNTLMKEFSLFFDTTCVEYTRYDFSKLHADEIYHHYQILEKKLFTKWKTPSINNYLSMIYFKVFRSLTNRWLSHIDTNLEKDLLLVNNSHKSVESTRELARITQVIRQNKTLYEMLTSTKPEMCHQALNNPLFDDFNKIITEHILTNNQQNAQLNLTIFYSNIQNDLKSDQSSIQLDKPSENDKRLQAEKLINSNLKGIKKYIYNRCLNKTRQAVKNREIANFYKKRVNGIIHSMFQGIGHDFVKNNVIDSSDDIFYLDLNQLKSALNGTFSTQEIRESIQTKKDQYKDYKQMDPPARIVTNGPVYWLNNSDEYSLQSQPTVRSLRLKGNGASGGVVEGKVKVITDSADIKDIHGEILVTTKTDSNLMQFIPSIAGLLVEGGTQFSHSVIIAREIGLPVITGVNNLTKILKTGMKVRIDGTAGNNCDPQSPTKRFHRFCERKKWQATDLLIKKESPEKAIWTLL